MFKKMLCPFVFIIIVLLSGCKEIHDEIFVQIYPIEGYKLIERAMFTSNNGYTRELYFSFKNDNGKNATVLALVKSNTSIIDQATGKALTVADIKPGMFAALYFDEADCTDGIPKKAQAMRIVLLENQAEQKQPETKGKRCITNAVVERVSNNTVTVLLNRTLQQPQFMKLYITPSTRFYGEKGQPIAYTAVKRGDICTVYMPENADVYGRDMLSCLVITS